MSTTDPTHRGLAVEFNSVSFAYGGNLVVDELSLRIGAGEFFTLLGPSGCGKTTTLRLVAGVLTPSGGTIRLGDRDVTRIPVHKRHVAMVFQNYALMPHKSVRENVAYGLASAGLGRQERQQRADAALARVGLTGYGERYPAQLSGGQQQRVGLARAVAVDSGVMLLDEPLSNLDTSLRQQMCLELRELQQDLGVTILYVTHDRNEALSMSDRIGVMEDGRILGLGTPAELYERPRDLRIARMLGDVIVLPQSAQSRTSRSGSIALEEPDPDGGSPTLAVRPEHFRVIGPQGPPTASNVLDGQVRRLEYVGAQTNLFVDVPGMGHPLLVRVPADQVASVPAKGEPVRIGWRVADTLELTGPR